MNTEEIQETERHYLCPAAELDEYRPRGYCLDISGEPLGVLALKAEGEVYAYVNSCPHTGVTLDWIAGRFMDITNTHLQCATHGALFRPQDGYCVRGPCAGQSLTPLSILVTHGLVYVLKPGK